MVTFLININELLLQLFYLLHLHNKKQRKVLRTTYPKTGDKPQIINKYHDR